MIDIKQTVAEMRVEEKAARFAPIAKMSHT